MAGVGRLRRGLHAGVAALVLATAASLPALAAGEQPEKPRSGPLDAREPGQESLDERRQGSDDLGGRTREGYPSTTLEPGQAPQVPGTGGGLGDPDRGDSPEEPRQ